MAATTSASGAAAVVLGPLHVSCFVTAANRATPVFDVQPDRKCVRVVTHSPPPVVHGDGSLMPSASTTTTPSGASAETPSVEWEFHSVFASATHSAAFFHDITQPAVRGVVVDGINTNLLATGIHPTQKFRFLFGRSASTAAPIVAAPSPDEAAVLDLHGQLGGLLYDFFHRLAGQQQLGDWSLGISSWIIVNNQAVDLLQPLQPESTANPALSFVSIEATSFVSALQTLQTAKTHRIVRKHTAEHSHFFVRLAFFHRPTGQLSTLHLVDLIDLKDFRDDAASTQEKVEFYEILHEIRQQTNAMAARATGSLMSPKPKPALHATKKTMLLSNFLQPLLTQNARTFLYANVIDSRASLRESVTLLNAVANVKGYACVCKRLTGIEITQLGFQPPPPLPSATEQNPVDPDEVSIDSAAAKAMAAVAIGESLLNRLASGPSRSPVLASTVRGDAVGPQPIPPSPVVTSDAMSWLEAFKQRKKDILAGGTVPPVVPVSTTSNWTPIPGVLDELPLGLSDLSPSATYPQPSSAQGAVGGGGTSSDLYTRLMETIEQATTSRQPSRSTQLATNPTIASMRMQLRRSNSMPLPIEDSVDDMLLPPCPPPPLPQPQHQSAMSHDLATRLAVTLMRPGRSGGAVPSTEFIPVQSTRSPAPEPTLPSIELPSQVMTPPNLEGLDPVTAAKIQATDTALLRKNYDALLTVVREQQQLREAAEAHAAEIVHDHEERRAQYEVHIENLKLEVVALKSKVRALERQSGVNHVFEQYESEIQSLQREVQQLRMQNVELELRLASSASSGDVSLAPSPGVLGGPGSLTELKKRYQSMAQDKFELERQLAELRKKERQFHAQSKLIHESTRKADRLARELTEREDALTSTRLGKQRLSAEVALAQQETQQLQQENERLLLEKAATTEELLAAKMYLASIESEQKKAEILDKFVRKHGDRMQRLRGRSGGESNNMSATVTWLEPENWRRDTDAREAEEKLFQGVKRSVPQLVPLANKVLRKLEVQELSLREFAEREVDFINLLVELASDQPALALKTMIEEEMKKLSLF